MTDPIVSDTAVPARAGDDKLLPIVVYVLYLIGFANGLTTIIGFVMAYALKGKSIEPARSHYVFQIRSVWIALVWCVLALVIAAVGLPLSIVLIGLPLLYLAWAIWGLTAVWFAVRAVVGLIFIARGEAYPRPNAWLI